MNHTPAELGPTGTEIGVGLSHKSVLLVLDNKTTFVASMTRVIKEGRRCLNLWVGWRSLMQDRKIDRRMTTKCLAELVGVFAFSSALSISSEPQPVTISSNRLVQPVYTNQIASQRFELKPTGVAPAGASGVAELHSGTISLHLSQIGPGRYELEAQRQSDGTFELLGPIFIVDPTLTPDRDTTENKKEASNSDSVLIKTDAQVTPRPSVRLLNIRNVRLLGPGGIVVLSSEIK